MFDSLLWELKAQKRAFQISFDLATKHGIILTKKHPMFKEAVELIWKHIYMGILGNKAIENLILILIYK